MADAVVPGKLLGVSANPPMTYKEITACDDSCAADWFAHQSKLPPLPLPALAPTFERYLETARPLLTDSEYEHTEGVVRAFLAEGGEGAALQAVLEGRAASMRNWIEDWWEQFAYLRTRTTMAISINWFGVTPEFHGAPLGRWNSGVGNVDGAAMTIHALLDVYATLRAGRFAAEKSPLARGEFLDMHQFGRVFGTTRVPQAGQDTLYQDAESKHIVLLRKGALVRVPVYDGSGRPLGLAQLKRQLADAVAAVDNDVLMEQRDEPPLSTLTALERDCWAEEREAMQNDDPINAASLLEVESALFHLTLHEASPATKEEAATLCHGGDGRNKWFDKSFNIILFENGKGGLNAEHTAVDAMTLVSIFSEANARIAKLYIEQRPALDAPPPPRAAAVEPPRKLKWALGARTHMLIERASAEIGALAYDCELRAVHYPHFGKGAIKRYKIQPDLFMQMALQLALYRLHGECWATYETGHTRSFFHGRTDTIRTLSTASVEWVKAMENVHVDVDDKWEALKAALLAHGMQLMRVLRGEGIDRHLMGLYVAAVMGGGELPPVFTDHAFKKSGMGGNFRLSTSNVGYTPQFGGFAPMTPDGYGACYALLEGRINIGVSAWRSCALTDCAKFARSIEGALRDTMALVVAAHPDGPPSKL